MQSAVPAKTQLNLAKMTADFDCGRLGHGLETTVEDGVCLTKNTSFCLDPGLHDGPVSSNSTRQCEENCCSHGVSAM